MHKLPTILAALVLSAVIFVELASAGVSACYTLIRISEREVAITCGHGDPSASKTPAGMLVVTCPE